MPFAASTSSPAISDNFSSGVADLKNLVASDTVSSPTIIQRTTINILTNTLFKFANPKFFLTETTKIVIFTL